MDGHVLLRTGVQIVSLSCLAFFKQSVPRAVAALPSLYLYKHFYLTQAESFFSQCSVVVINYIIEES